MLHTNLLIILLLSSIILTPLPYIGIRYFNKYSPNDSTAQKIWRTWLYFIIILLCLRFFTGLVLLITKVSLSGVSYFYPIRIAYPNYGLFQGLPYLLICLAIFSCLKPIQNFFNKDHLIYYLLWFFSVILLLSFGGIHGGLITGNAWISGALDHLKDANLNKTITEVFATHIDRINGLITPEYSAPHSISHPALVIAYWQMMTKYTTPFIFSVVNTMFFTIALYVIYWALLRRKFNTLTSFQSVLLCLLIPAILIYGRSDDMIYNSFAIVIFAIMSVAIQEKRYFLTLLSSILFVAAMNFSYAAFVLLPAIFSLNASMRLTQIWQYIRSIIPHLIIFLIIISVALILENKIAHYDWFKGFQASAHWNKGSNIISIIQRGLYIRAINERLMAIGDFLIFGGPVFLYLFISLFKNRNKNFLNWKIKNFALFSLFLILAINSNGPGEVSRPWGSLFLLTGFSWFPEFLNKESEKSRGLLIHTQFAWALFLQTFLNFGW